MRCKSFSNFGSAPQPTSLRIQFRANWVYGWDPIANPAGKAHAGLGNFPKTTENFSNPTNAQSGPIRTLSVSVLSNKAAPFPIFVRWCCSFLRWQNDEKVKTHSNAYQFGWLAKVGLAERKQWWYILRGHGRNKAFKVDRRFFIFFIKLEN